MSFAALMRPFSHYKAPLTVNKENDETVNNFKTNACLASKSEYIPEINVFAATYIVQSWKIIGATLRSRNRSRSSWKEIEFIADGHAMKGIPTWIFFVIFLGWAENRRSSKVTRYSFIFSFMRLETQSRMVWVWMDNLRISKLCQLCRIKLLLMKGPEGAIQTIMQY